MAKSIETPLPEIFVLFPGSLGDFVCVLPALEVLKRASRTQRIAVAVRGQPLDLASRIPWISSALSLDSGVFASLFSSSTAVNREVAQLFSSIRRILSWFGHGFPEVRATLERFVPNGVQSFAFFKGQEKFHACQYYLSCLGSSAISCPSLFVRDEDKKWCDTYWQSKGWKASSRILVIHPGSGGKRKRWALEGFTHVARWWRSRANRHIVILLGPAEEDEGEMWRREGIVEDSLPLWQAAALLSRTDVYAGNDSGVSHLAGAVGARGAVVFGPTCPKQWRPLGGALTVVANRACCATVSDVSDVVGISLQEVPPESVISELALTGGIS